MGISVRNHRDNTSRSRIVTAINKMGGACTSRRILWLPRSRPLVGILHVISFLLRTETFPPSLSLPPPPTTRQRPGGRSRTLPSSVRPPAATYNSVPDAFAVVEGRNPCAWRGGCRFHFSRTIIVQNLCKASKIVQKASRCPKNFK